MEAPERLPGTSLAEQLHMLRTSLALAAMLCLASGCPEQLPQQDLCSAVGEAQVSRIEVGDAYEGFMPLGPESFTEVQYGAQGGAMLFFKVRAFGTQMPTCMTVQLRLTSDEGETMANTEVAVNFYEDQSGMSRTSRPLQLTLYGIGPFDGQTATLHTQIGSAAMDAEVTIREP